MVADSQQLRWGDLEEDDGSDYDFLLSPKKVVGVKKGRSWIRFGDAVDQDVNARLTMVSSEEIIFERPRDTGMKAEDSNASAGAVLMVCRSCGKKGDHWTSKCPYKDLNPDSSAATGATNGAYVPPTRRGGAVMRRRNDENSVRVNNLSEDTKESDLLELFRPFGSVSRVYVATDQKTGMCRGFGFVNFVRRDEGERAIAKLNGYGYDNLILSVEWAVPRAT